MGLSRLEGSPQAAGIRLESKVVDQRSETDAAWRERVERLARPLGASLGLLGASFGLFFLGYESGTMGVNQVALGAFLIGSITLAVAYVQRWREWSRETCSWLLWFEMMVTSLVLGFAGLALMVAVGGRYGVPGLATIGAVAMMGGFCAAFMTTMGVGELLSKRQAGP